MPSSTTTTNVRPVGLSVVVPCYNEEHSLTELYRRVSAACRVRMGNDYELVLVNDGSKDATWSIIRTIALDDLRVVAVNLSRNHGHQLALSAGLSVCQGQRILIMDADLQDPPELLPQMMALMDRGADVVFGQREKREGETWMKRACAVAFYRLLDHIVDVQIPVDTGDFRLMSRRALDILNRMPERHRFIRGMVSWIGLNQVPLKYVRHARFAGETKYPLRKMILFALDAITAFSVVPLRIASHLGMIFSFIALIYLGYVGLAWFRGDVLEGWTSVISVVLIMGSMQLIVMGILGEYVGRIFMEAKQRPMFLIADIIVSDRREAAGPSHKKIAGPIKVPTEA